MRLAVLFDNFGPYHIARLSTLAKNCNVLGIETRSKSLEYGWNPGGEPLVFQRKVLSPSDDMQSSSRRAITSQLGQILSDFSPEVVAISGYSQPVSLAALGWTTRNNVPSICMSDSQRIDAVRSSHTEWLKSRIVGMFTCALVGGSRHRAYIAELGMRPERAHVGYDVVDNEYFARRAAEVRADEDGTRRAAGLPRHFFLCSSRFIQKKNLPTLLHAFAKYRAEIPSGLDDEATCKLVILGEGPMRTTLERKVAELGLQSEVLFKGFVQYSELPTYYALATALVHVSTVEQWGLVINEALASGLPVIVSQNCGCVPELVHHGNNGFIVDPLDSSAIAQRLQEIAESEPLRKRMGEASTDLVASWGLERFAQGMQAAAEQAIQVGAVHGTKMAKVILRAALLKTRTM